MNIQEEILNSMQIMIDKSLEKATTTKTIPSVVEGISNNKYVVTIDGNRCEIYDSVGCNPTIGKGVWVQIPNGDLKKAFITGLRGNAEGGGGGGGGVRSQADWYETNPNSPSFIRNKYITINKPSNRSNLESKDNFNVAFSKIAKYFDDLGQYAFKSELKTSDIIDLGDALSKPITSEMIRNLFI